MTQSVLVTGANGFFGRLLVPALREHATVFAGVRAGGDADAGTRILGDLSELPDLTAALDGIDCIVHCAARAHVLREETDDPLPLFRAANRDATLHLARQAAAAGVKRMIFLSSIGVNGNQTDGTPFRADDPPAPHAPYAISKLEAEIGLTQIAAETGLEVVVIRPPLIIGPAPVGNLRTLSRLIAKGLPMPFGAATRNRRSLVLASTLADLIRVCLSHPNAPGEPLLVADTPPLSTRRILEHLARETGQQLRLLPVPVGLLRMSLRALGRGTIDQQLFGDLEIDISQTTARLGWTPPTRQS